ncbi:MAG: Glycosyl transferase, WecB/TagA/CpsF family [Berkelbacteria bacterium GW2011_GWB1_38_5]|uniref:Glycosyl transferase, WecB/TagA/CpsF family n=2 Tax=Candidatus Berkelbacteria TaxID=1618330 RepID=A0A0G0NYC6_9BACT|nr:MAG: Glycosyl transferase, WecB/TagA/CpsF family [Berkelbacteria bacterium GW2011_GWB1_38_5]KKQ90844.1 MAG: Glycosyl transferase, WecB/TagA/CpsF family [Berkelbacteria bacterium GW2011_GWA1_39_10]
MKISILDVKIDNLKFPQVMQKITLFLNEKKLHQIVTVNAEFIMAAQKDEEFKKVLNSADLAIPDGSGPQYAAWFLGQKIGERIPGVDLTWKIAKMASEKGYSIFLLGAAKGIAEKTAYRLKLVHSDLKIAGTYAGSPNDKKVFELLKKAKPDVLLVAFGAPRQDKFIFNLKTNFSDFGFRVSDLPKVAMGVGGTFDYIAEVVPRAPKWMRILGLEWLYRLVKQPKRIGRIYTAVIKFPLLVLFNKFFN